jgi:hypothetical protein
MERTILLSVNVFNLFLLYFLFLLQLYLLGHLCWAYPILTEEATCLTIAVSGNFNLSLDVLHLLFAVRLLVLLFDIVHDAWDVLGLFLLLVQTLLLPRLLADLFGNGLL